MHAPHFTARLSPAKSFTLVLGAGGLLVACGDAGSGGDSRPNQSALAIPLAQVSDTAGWYADRLLVSLGGPEAWDRTRYLNFRWVVELEGAVVANREHSWDRDDGRYRVAYEQDGVAHLLLFNIHELDESPELGRVPTGRAWVGDEELDGTARDSALRRGYSAFINDTYWALMPFKWRDPGVHLSYEGHRTLSDGVAYPTVHLRFDEGLGMTEDRYWGFLDPESGRLVAWQYHLGRSDAPGDVIWWTDWTQVGSIRFALSRSRDDGQRFIYFEDVAASETVPEGRFDPPAP